MTVNSSILLNNNAANCDSQSKAEVIVKGRSAWSFRVDYGKDNEVLTLVLAMASCRHLIDRTFFPKLQIIQEENSE